jgi:hypothetical protein
MSDPVVDILLYSVKQLQELTKVDRLDSELKRLKDLEQAIRLKIVNDRQEFEGLE